MATICRCNDLWSLVDQVAILYPNERSPLLCSTNFKLPASFSVGNGTNQALNIQRLPRSPKPPCRNNHQPATNVFDESNLSWMMKAVESLMLSLWELGNFQGTESLTVSNATKVNSKKVHSMTKCIRFLYAGRLMCLMCLMWVAFCGQQER